MYPAGTFLVVGENPPQVHMLTRDEITLFYERCRISAQAVNSEAAMAQTFKLTFGVVGKYALPGWVPECMEGVATKYDGPHQTAVRGIAACLATGLPYTRDSDNTGKGGPPQGGERVPIRPDKPLGGQPAKRSALDELLSAT